VTDFISAVRTLFLGLMLGVSPSAAQSTICYVRPGGDDLNSGSQASPKRTVMGCYDDLPIEGGTIYVEKNAPATGVAGQGLWIMGRGDPQYSSPPSGWRRGKRGGVRIIGVGGTLIPAFGRIAQVNISGGSYTSPGSPALWLSSVSSGMSFENINFSYPCVGVRLGLDSTGTVSTSAVGTWNVNFENVSVGLNNIAGCGPAVQIGTQSMWIFFKDSELAGNAAERAAITSAVRSSNFVTVTTAAHLPSSWATGMDMGVIGVADKSFNSANPSVAIAGPNKFTYHQDGPDAASSGGYAVSDRGQVIVMNPKSTPGGLTALTYVSDTLLDNSGIKLYRGQDGGEVYVENILQEAGVSPSVWVATCGTTHVNAKNIETADPINKFGAVTTAADCGDTWAIQVQNASTSGPLTLLGGAGPLNLAENPELEGEYGLFNGFFVGNLNHARRGFGPVNSRFPNLVSQVLPTGVVGSKTYTRAVAPDGTGNAVSITSTRPNDIAILYMGRQEISAGDIFICGAWVRALNPPGFFSSDRMPLNCFFPSLKITKAWNINQGGAQWANGEWDWVWMAFKVSSTSAPFGALEDYVTVGHSKGIGIYAPIVVRISSGAVADNEAIEYGQTLQTFRDDAAPGQVSLLRGEQFKADSIQVGDGPTISSGKGAPKGPASPGSIYLRQDGGAGTTLYMYESGEWKAKL